MNMPQSRESWEQTYLEVKAFREGQGHCEVPMAGATLGLGMWLEDQRLGIQRGQVVGRRRRLLLALGVRVSLKAEVNWLLRFRELRRHRKVTGAWPQYWAEEAERKLYLWLVQQRAQMRKKTFEWWKEELFLAFQVPREVARGRPRGQVGAVWRQWFEKLAQFRQERGHCHVSVTEKELKSLGLWCTLQRMARKQGTLPADRLAELEKLGFVWEPWDISWRRRLEELKVFQAQHGHLRVPGGEPAWHSLFIWVQQQRRAKVLGEMSAERERQLLELGFRFAPQAEERRQLMEALVAFHAEHGHYKLPYGHPQDKWVASLRRRKRQGMLAEEEVAQLEGVGFAWEVPRRRHAPKQDAQWEERFQQLLAYKARHGHVNIQEHEVTEWPNLGYWAAAQRRRYRAGGIRAERARRLEELGFVWRVLDAQWEAQFEKLKAFQQQRGHGHVGCQGTEETLLWEWLDRQRARHEEGRLEPERVARLKALGWRRARSRVRRAGGVTTAATEAAETEKSF